MLLLGLSYSIVDMTGVTQVRLALDGPYILVRFVAVVVVDGVSPVTPGSAAIRGLVGGKG